MIKLKSEYVKNWLILAIFLVASLVLLILVLFANLSNIIKIIVLTLWIIIVFIGILNSLQVSRQTILKDAESKKSNSKNTFEIAGDIQKKPQSDTFDIQSKSNKIIRRISFQQDESAWSNELLSRLVSELEIMSGIIYKKNKKGEFESIATYAYPHTDEPRSFKEGEGLNGQTAKNQQILLLKKLPEDYLQVFSGLGSGIPSYLGIAPVIISNTCMYIIEIAGFRWAEQRIDQLLQNICKSLSEKLSDIKE